MTPEEYAREIANKLRKAHNTQNVGDVSTIFEGADKALKDGGISPGSQERFWANVRAHLAGDVLLVEKQANSSLLALMRAIEQQLAAREKK